MNTSAGSKAENPPTWPKKLKIHKCSYGGLFYCLVIESVQAEQLSDEFGIPLNLITTPGVGVNGLTQTFSYEGIEEVSMVRLAEHHARGGDMASLVGTLAHEAMHVWRYYMEHIGEKDPSEEFAAYSYAEILQTLVTDLLHWIRS